MPAVANSGSGPAPFPLVIRLFLLTPLARAAALRTFPAPDRAREPTTRLICVRPQPGGPCPGAVPRAGVVIGHGNGISHSNVNAADDWWATSTSKAVADVFVLLRFDSNGPIPALYFATGHQMQWFGNSLNAKNFVLHDTANIR